MNDTAALPQPRRITARRVFAACAVGYALLVLGYLALRLLVSDADGGVFGMMAAIGSSLMPAILLPALPLAIAAAVLRLPKTALLLAPLGLAFALIYGGALLPRPAQSAPGTPPFVVYTHNLHVMADDLSAAAEAIRASGADVVALQELSEPAAAYFAATLNDLYPYRSLHPEGLTTSGIGILSRWPLSDEEVWRTSMLQMRATVNWPGGAFAFYALHPPPPRWFLRPFDATDRGIALNAVLERAAQETLPVVLAGDFNLTDQTSDYQRILSAGYQDAFREAGWGLGLTFADFGSVFAPLSLAPPFIRIDYIFASEGFTPMEASVGASAAGSDHYPVRAALALAAAQQ